jgi:hypothetical protein
MDISIYKTDIQFRISSTLRTAQKQRKRKKKKRPMRTMTMIKLENGLDNSCML